jgi:uncharacterized protein (DUF952 family)
MFYVRTVVIYALSPKQNTCRQRCIQRNDVKINAAQHLQSLVDKLSMIYKICTQDEWRHFSVAGEFAGSPDDLRDGFIHLSGPDQVARTAAKFFTGRTDLILLEIDPARLGNSLRWEPSASGTIYPHVYGPLPMAAVVASTPLTVAPDGRHILPPELG